jgi:hypothetical protein
MMESLVSKLSIVLSTPEDLLIKQGDSAIDGMYFIIIGDCTIDVLDQQREN